MRTAYRLKVYSQIVDDTSQGDEIHGHKRFLATSGVPNDVILAPGLNTIDAGFWSSWLASGPAPSLSRVIYPA
jgi:hypothetical protein